MISYIQRNLCLILVKPTYMSISTYDIYRNTYTMMYKDTKPSLLINGKTVVWYGQWVIFDNFPPHTWGFSELYLRFVPSKLQFSVSFELLIPVVYRRMCGQPPCSVWVVRLRREWPQKISYFTWKMIFTSTNAAF